jgi:hypothetical protein
MVAVRLIATMVQRQRASATNSAYDDRRDGKPNQERVHERNWRLSVAEVPKHHEQPDEKDRNADGHHHEEEADPSKRSWDLAEDAFTVVNDHGAAMVSKRRLGHRFERGRGGILAHGHDGDPPCSKTRSA